MKFTQFIGGAVVLATVAAAGCSKQSASDAAPKEVRGETIASTPAPEPVKAAPAPEPVLAAPVVVPAPAPVPTVPAKEAAKTGEEEFATIGFEKLAGFNYDMPDESNVKTNAAATPVKEQIPADIKALDKKRIALKGFMLPLKVEGGLITELLIMRDQSMCCYGTVPKINEWVSVKMVGKGVKPVMDQAITLYGALKVGEMYESGYLVGIYAMDGEKMAGPLDL